MYNPMDLSGKTMLVTGASSGIGRATAIMLSRLGARVVLTGRRADALAETRLQMENPDLHVVAPYDLADLEGIPTWLKSVTQEQGLELDGLVHCAGISKLVPIRALSLSNIEGMLTPNLLAAMLLLKGVTAKGVGADGSSLVFITSVAAVSGSPGQVTYAASKGALISLVQAAAKELAPRKIRVNCVAPGIVETPMFADAAQVGGTAMQASIDRHALGLGQPADVAHAIAFLLGPAAHWITGTTLAVDGGYLA